MTRRGMAVQSHNRVEHFHLIMPAYIFEGRRPEIDETAFVFENATVIGDVKVGREVWIGPGAVIRGDYGTVKIGDYTAVEDNCVIHARPDEQTRIGMHVTLGHACVVHTATIDDWAVIGMGSVISDFASVGEWAAIGEGAVVSSRSQIEANSIAVGVPARKIGVTDEQYRSIWTAYKQNYNTFCRRYRKIVKMD